MIVLILISAGLLALPFSPVMSEESSSELNLTAVYGVAYGTAKEKGVAYSNALANVPIGAKVVGRRSLVINAGLENQSWSFWLSWKRESSRTENE